MFVCRLFYLVISLIFINNTIDINKTISIFVSLNNYKLKLKNMTTLQIETYELPAYWGSALINNDESGMEDTDIEEMNAWLDRVQPGSCVEVSEETYFGRFNSMGCDMATYTFIQY